MRHPELQSLRQQLRRRDASGNLSTEEQLILDNLELVFIVCHKTILNRPIEDDDVQAALMALLQAVRSYREGEQATFNTYASSCIRNALVKRWEHSHRMKRCHKHEQLRDHAASPASLEHEEDWSTAWTALKVLDRLDLAIVCGYYLSGLTFKQLGARHGMSRQAATQRLQTAMADVGMIAAALEG